MSERRPSSRSRDGARRSAGGARRSAGGARRSAGGRSSSPRSGGSRSGGGRSGDGRRSDGGRSGGGQRSGGYRGDSRGGSSRGESSREGRDRDNERPFRARRDDDRPRRPRRDDDRPGRPRRDDDRPFRARRDDDAPRRPRRDDDRPFRARRDDDAPRRPRRDDDRPGRPRRDDDRPFRARRDDDAPRRPRRDDDRPRRPRRDDDRPFRARRDEDRPFRGRRDDDNVPQTAAQRRRDEVRRRTGGRVTMGEMSRAPERTRVEWTDEGPVGRRSVPRGRERDASPKRSGRSRKELRALDSVVEEFEKKVRGKAASRAIRRYEEALVPFEAQRYDEARRLLLPMSKEYADVAAVHEMLGLCLYRAGRWSAAVRELERALELNPSWVFNHAVLADCHRALKNWSRVAQLWDELSAASPSAELVAEGRIVMAGAFADQGQIDEALRTMKKAEADQSAPKEHHLRQWFVIADLYDRDGNVMEARRFYERVARHDPQFVDVAERLSTLGA